MDFEFWKFFGLFQIFFLSFYFFETDSNGPEVLIQTRKYLGRSVRRSVLDASGKPISHSEGAVRGWLDASRSDYNDSEGKPAALWHVYFSSGELEGDEEDLELSELLESLVPKSDDTDDEQ